jgi:hypothetical protein
MGDSTTGAEAAVAGALGGRLLSNKLLKNEYSASDNCSPPRSIATKRLPTAPKASSKGVDPSDDEGPLDLFS